MALRKFIILQTYISDQEMGIDGEKLEGPALIDMSLIYHAYVTQGSEGWVNLCNKWGETLFVVKSDLEKIESIMEKHEKVLYGKN